MGISTDGQICFGIAFDEGYEFPWDKEYEGDLYRWWLGIKGWKPEKEIYDGTCASGYVNDIKPSEKEIDKYYESRRNFMLLNPLPIKLVNYCHCDNPIFIVAVPSSFIWAKRGYPEEFDPSKLFVSEKEKKDLTDFCEKYCKKDDMNPKWYLSSYFG